jgi:hypothetical protein
MKNQVTVLLKSGDKVTFDVDGAEAIAIRSQCTGTSFLTASDGVTYNFSTDEVAAMIIAPYTRCENCGSDVFPDVDTAYAGNKPIDVIKTCTVCGASMND